MNKMKNMNKKGAFTDLFLFMIVALIILLISGMYIYMGDRINTELQETLPGKEVGDTVNYTEILDNSIGQLSRTYNLLYWISILIIVAMVISIFIGSYMVTTRPIFFVPYIFIVIIAIIVSIGVSNAYEELALTPELAETFAGFVGSNYIMFYLPVWVTVIGFVGGIIMFVRMRQEEYTPYG